MNNPTVKFIFISLFICITVGFSYKTKSPLLHSSRNSFRVSSPSALFGAAASHLPIQKLSNQWKIIPDIWDTLAKLIPDKLMLEDPVFDESSPVILTYKQVNDIVTSGGAAFQKLGVLPGSCVAVFSENSHKWFLAEQSVMKAGAHNAVRGSSAPVEELQYIYNNSRSMGAVLESPSLLTTLYENGGLINELGKPKFIVILNNKGKSSAELEASIGGESKVIIFEDFLALSNKESFNSEFVPKNPDQIATLVYTSGTTSKPKGVVLKHKNLLYQVWGNSFTDSKTLDKMSQRSPDYDPAIGDLFLSILPCWHILERTAEYFCLARGTQICYTNLKNFKKDLAVRKPHFIIAVPRLFETVQKGIEKTLKEQPATKKKLINFFIAISKFHINSVRTFKNLLIRDSKPNPIHRLFSLLLAIFSWPLYKAADKIVWSKIRENLGGRVKIMVSGGSSIPTHIESFYDMIGLNIINGYGLTETSPVISNRVAKHNVMGTVGLPPPGTTLKVVDVETRQPLPVGKPGVLLAKGPGVMSGYNQNPTATHEAIDSDGFFNTGDLARVNPATGDFIITGRAKDTIVLSNGENIEPQSIEEAILATSPVVDQVMLVGQDEKYLSALLVLNVPELVSKGLIDSSKGSQLTSMISAVTSGGSGSGGSVSELRQQAAELGEIPAVKEFIMNDLNKIGMKLRPWERIGAISVILEPFSVQNGLLTQTLKIKRDKVTLAYKDAIKNIYNKKSK